MDAWNIGLSQISTFGNALLTKGVPNFADVNLNQISMARKAMQLAYENTVDELDKSLLSVFLAACDDDFITLENGIRNHKEYINTLYPSSSNGISLLIYAICYSNSNLVEALLNHDADPDLPDSVLGFTPLMWAVYTDQLEMVKLLMNQQADPYLSPKDNGKNAITFVKSENTEMYEYFKSHNLLKRSISNVSDDLYNDQSFTNDEVDDITQKLKLQTITVDNSLLREDEENARNDAYSEENQLSMDHMLVQLKEFEYDKILPNEYIKFTDSDIPSLLDYIFDLRINKVNYQHDTKIPAAIVFQLIRFADMKVESNELTEFTFDCFIARLRAVTNTKSGVFNMIIQDDPQSTGGAGDIVLLSYWMSVIQFLHFYFCKQDIYKKYPKFLQELVNITQSLVSTLSFSINSRLNLLVDDCLLNFTNLVDVSNVLYAKDWNLFKSKKKVQNNFDAIHDMLYPPSQSELMKPSPLKYIQTLGALDYVLNLHQVDNLIKNQCFSQVFYYIDAIIFNKLISQSKYSSRSKAIQIRLNISAIEDWLRSHNYNIFHPEKVGDLQSLIKGSEFHLTNILDDNEKANKRNPNNLIFQYNSIYTIGKTQLQPTIELLQLLQCISSLNDDESLINTINQFDYLNYYQLLKVTKTYKYEVDEKKLSKSSVNLIKKLMNEHGESQIKRINLNYMIQNKLLLKEYNIYINPNHVYKSSIPNLAELINNYGSGLGGIRVLRAKKFQPTLPIDLLDDLDELLSQNKNDLNDTYDYDQEIDKDDEAYELETEKHGYLNLNASSYKGDIKGDELFKLVQMPSSLAHKNWGDDDDIEANPW